MSVKSNTVNASNAIVIGNGNAVTGLSATAIGRGANASGAYSIVVGAGATDTASIRRRHGRRWCTFGTAAARAC